MPNKIIFVYFDFNTRYKSQNSLIQAINAHNNINLKQKHIFYSPTDMEI